MTETVKECYLLNRLSQFRREPALYDIGLFDFHQKIDMEMLLRRRRYLFIWSCKSPQKTEPQVIVESFLIIAMDALDLVSVAPQRSRTDAFASNAVFHTKQIWRMHAFCLCRVAKFAAIAALYYLHYITQPVNCMLHKVHCCEINFSRFRKAY